MERLTHQGEHGPYWDKAVFDKHGGMEEDLIIDRLAYYEDMEEQGRLVVLPCQWGTKLYSVFAARHNLLDDGEPPIREIQLVEDNVCPIVRQFGKTVFLNREEAENALKGGADK